MIAKKWEFIKKVGILIMIIWINVQLCGCYAQREPQNRNYIMCMGIDAVPGGWRIAYGFPDLAMLTGTDSNSAEPVQVIEVENIREGAARLNAASDKIADYSQLSVIVLGDSLQKDPERRSLLIDELTKEKDIKRTVMIVYAAGKAEEIVQLDETVNGSIGVFIYELGQNNYEDRGYDLSVLEDFAGGRSSDDCVVPVFASREERPVLVEFSDDLRYTDKVGADKAGQE